MKDETRVLFLTKYGRSGPSSRYRVLQYLPSLEARGIGCTVQSLHTDDYLETVYAGCRKSPWYWIVRLLARAQAVARGSHYDAVFVQKELAPYLPPVLELLLSAMRVKVIYDLDDAIWLRYRESPNQIVRTALGRKIPFALRRSAVVLAGNAHLAKYALRFNRSTVLFPTVVDTARYPARDGAPGGAGTAGDRMPVVGWIGSPETVRFLTERSDVLRAVAREVPFELHVIGAAGVVVPGLDVRCVPWSEETEASELAQCDIGIMPLPASAWAKGKCGLKLLQYLASGMPVISSPDGGADLIVEHGVTGYVARSDEEWRVHLVSLLDNPELRKLMGREGRGRVERSFSLATWAPRMADVILDAIRDVRSKETES